MRLAIGSSGRRRRLRAAFAAAAACFFARASARAGDIEVAVSGRYAGSVSSYRLGGAHYLEAKQAGEVYGGQVYWYPVTGRVQISLRGQQLRFMTGSKEVQLGSQGMQLSNEIVTRASRAFIPLEFFLSPEFAAFSRMDSQFNAETGHLSIEPRATVGPLKWFSYQDKSRVELPLDAGVGFTIHRQGKSGIEVSMPLGQIEGSEMVQVGDGILDALRLRQEPKTVLLAIRFDPGAKRWESRELKEPRRLVIDVYGKSKPVAYPEGVPPSGTRTPSGSPRVAAEDALAAAGMPAASTAATRTEAVAGPRKRKIVVDAGHGGKDEGASSRRRTLEKTVNLLAAKELARLLKEEDAFEVILTREDDTFVALDERSRIANDAQADLFISLHCNATRDRSENGFEIYFLSERASDPESQRVADIENAVLRLEGKSGEEFEAQQVLHALARTEYINDGAELAGLIARNFDKRVNLGNRGVKQAAFYVLRGTNAPAVLVELAFLTNKKDEAKLQSRRFRRKLAEGIYAGILDFTKRHNWELSQ
ncbi:MAG: N-acetylmuramoyl-L-alanine amidase [Elusimicrobia bacterium]|nr:N-acetylmuramoyl-L-alanine amidase [Elusimicrobiota bacterium]